MSPGHEVVTGSSQVVLFVVHTVSSSLSIVLQLNNIKKANEKYQKTEPPKRVRNLKCIGHWPNIICLIDDRSVIKLMDIKVGIQVRPTYIPYYMIPSKKIWWYSRTFSCGLNK